MDADISRRILEIAREKQVTLNQKQLRQIRACCEKRVNKTMHDATCEIIDEELENFLIDQEDRELELVS